MTAKMYQCHHCGEFIEADTQPNPLGCQCAARHRWYEVAESSAVISTYFRHRRETRMYIRATKSTQAASERNELASCIPQVSQAVMTFQSKRDAVRAQALAGPGLLNEFVFWYPTVDETERICSRELAFLLDPKKPHGPVLLNLFLRTIATGVQSHDDAAAMFYPAGLDATDCQHATVTLPDAATILISIPNWGMVCIDNATSLHGNAHHWHHYAAALQQQRRIQGGRSLLLHLTSDGTPSKSPGDFADDYFRISYCVHIARWLNACLAITLQQSQTHGRLRQFRAAVYAITNNDYHWEKQYMEKVMELIRHYPAIIASMDDLRHAVERIRSQCFDVYWAEVRRRLGETGIHIGEIGFQEEIDVFWPVTIERKNKAMEQSILTPKIWCDPLGNELFISLELPQDEGEAAAWIVHAETDYDRGWLTASKLPGEFSNKSLSRLIADPAEMQCIASETAAAIRQYINRVQSLPQKDKK